MGVLNSRFEFLRRDILNQSDNICDSTYQTNIDSEASDSIFNKLDGQHCLETMVNLQHLLYDIVTIMALMLDSHLLTKYF